MSLEDRLKARLELKKREIAEESQRSDEHQERLRVTRANFEARFEALEKRLHIEESVRQICLALDAEFIKRPMIFLPELHPQKLVGTFRYEVNLGKKKNFSFVVEVLENSTHIYLWSGQRADNKIEITESDFLNQDKMESLVWEAYCHPIDPDSYHDYDPRE